MNMTKKLVFLTILLLTFNASASSGTEKPSAEDEQIPRWSKTFNIIHYTPIHPGSERTTTSFSSISRNEGFIMILNGEIHAALRKKDGPLIFKKGTEKFGLIPLEDCELSVEMPLEEFYSALCGSFNVAEF